MNNHLHLGRHHLRYSKCQVCITGKHSLDYHRGQLELSDLQEELDKANNKIKQLEEENKKLKLNQQGLTDMIFHSSG